MGSWEDSEDHQFCLRRTFPTCQVLGVSLDGVLRWCKIKRKEIQTCALHKHVLCEDCREGESEVAGTDYLELLWEVPKRLFPSEGVKERKSFGERKKVVT